MPQMLCSEESIVVFAVKIHNRFMSTGYYCGLGSSVSIPHDSDPFHVSYVGETCVGVNQTTIGDIGCSGH